MGCQADPVVRGLERRLPLPAESTRGLGPSRPRVTQPFLPLLGAVWLRPELLLALGTGRGWELGVSGSGGAAAVLVAIISSSASPHPLTLARRFTSHPLPQSPTVKHWSPNSSAPLVRFLGRLEGGVSAFALRGNGACELPTKCQSLEYLLVL